MLAARGLTKRAGTISIDGCSLTDDPVAYKRGIGYVPEEPHLYTHLTAAEYLTLVGRLRGIPTQTLQERVSRLLHLFLLHDSRYGTMRGYSKGMRQRVLLAAALLHNPELLVLDEPFSGLDVTAGLLFRSLLGLLAAEGRMILFSTHRFDMVEQLCSRVVILSAGRIVVEQQMDPPCGRAPGSLEELFARATNQDDSTPVAREIFNTIQAA